MNPKTPYPASVYWSDDDQGFLALAPDLPGCSAFGSTQSEALTELADAIDAWLEAARAAGNPIPEPSALALPPSASGKVLVRMPKSLHAQLLREADTERTSMNQLVVYLLATSLRSRAAPADQSAQMTPTAANFEGGTAVLKFFREALDENNTASGYLIASSGSANFPVFNAGMAMNDSAESPRKAFTLN